MHSEDKIVLVLGMHRSGTSCLAGCLQQAGLFLGDVVTSARFNRRGSRESREIRALHDRVLKKNSAAWDRPPEAVPSWDQADRQAMKQLIGSFSGRSCWGFKDPRTLLVIDQWLRSLEDCVLVATFRNPLDVAKSLASRNDFSLQKGLDLWLHYNRILLELKKKLDFPLVCFDPVGSAYVEQLEMACAMLSLEPPAGGFSFIDTRLKHHATPAAELCAVAPESVVDTYQQLLDLSLAAAPARNTCLFPT